MSGFPCVFYGDYYGIPSQNVSSKSEIINKLLFLRKKYVYGTMHNYFDHHNIVGWTLEGDNEHSNSGIAVLLSDLESGKKKMYIGKNSSPIKQFLK